MRFVVSCLCLVLAALPAFCFSKDVGSSEDSSWSLVSSQKSFTDATAETSPFISVGDDQSSLTGSGSTAVERADESWSLVSSQRCLPGAFVETSPATSAGDDQCSLTSFPPIKDEDSEESTTWEKIQTAFKDAGDSEHWARFKTVAKVSGKTLGHGSAVGVSFLVDAGLGFADSMWHLVKNTGSAFWNSQLSVPKLLKDWVGETPKWSPPSLSETAGAEEIVERFSQRVLIGLGITVLNTVVLIADGLTDVGVAFGNAGVNAYHAFNNGHIAKPDLLKKLFQTQLNS